MPRQPQCVPNHKFAINIQLTWKPYKCKNQKIESNEIKNTIIIKCRKKRQQMKIAKHHTIKNDFFYPSPPKSKTLTFLLVLYFMLEQKNEEKMSLFVCLYQAHILIVV